ncbi:MAG TPA: GTPase ObgE, partial [Methyloceanibacter sp.]|nr:GTPase ObgE [Methyloceanibacter sp.]
YRIISGELEGYGAGLEEKPEIVALSKADAVPADELKRKAKALTKAAGRKPLVLSAVTGEGMTPALRELAKVIKAARTKRDAPKTHEAGWQP